jgi:hypothetical protein
MMERIAEAVDRGATQIIGGLIETEMLRRRCSPTSIPVGGSRAAKSSGRFV